jgi:sugar lactone lactonase YvrE
MTGLPLALGVAVGLALYLLLWPVGIDPVAWDPEPSRGFTGLYAANEVLTRVEKLARGCVGPETVTLGPDGRLYAGLRDGRIIRVAAEGGGDVETFASTGGSPGGMAFDATGNLIVADADRGLLSIGPDGAIRVLAQSIAGERMLFLDSLAIASDGTIWFTDGSQRYPEHHDISEFLEGRATGRLLTHDALTGETRVRLSGLRFANGVAFGPGETYVLVNETLGYRTTRLWLTGPRAGETEPFLTNLPVLPDNITFNGQDLFWIAGVYPRDALMDWLPRQGAFLKKILMRIPMPVLEAIGRPRLHGFVIAVDLDGNVVHNLQDTTGHYGAISNATEVNGSLYLGSISMPTIGRIAVPIRTRRSP